MPMPVQTTSLFIDKAIERLDRIDRAQLENILRGLRRERQFLQDVFDRLAEGVLVVNADWEVVWTNRSARKLLGLERQRRLVGERLLNLPLDPALLDCLRHFSLNPSESFQKEIVTRVPKEAITSVTLVSGGDMGQAQPGCVMIVEDLTEQRVEQARRQEAEKIASLSTLTAGVAHEIKNPLNSLKIHAQLLNRTIKDEEEAEHKEERLARSTRIILEEIDRLGKVVDEFLTAARPTQPELRMQRLSPVIERLAEIVRPELAEKRIVLALDLDPEIVELQLDEQQMIQALINVVRNAGDAIETKRRNDPEAEGRIEIRTRSDRKHVWIFITDTGCGIAQEDLQRILEPYYTTKFGGTGLGMMVVYRVVREHNGRLHIQSELDLGTTITITLARRAQLPRSLTHTTNAVKTEAPSPTQETSA